MSDTRTLTAVQSSAAPDTTSTSVVAFRVSKAGETLRQKLLGDERLIQLRQAIVKGAYQVDPRRIAGKLLKRD